MPTLDPRTRNIALLVLVPVVFVTGGAWATYRYALPPQGSKPGYAATDAFKQSIQSGAYVASSAASLAQTEHISYSNLTESILNAKRSDETWVSATTNALTSGDAYKFVVSVEAADDHVVAAVEPLRLCLYGLTVSGPTDPIIRQDQLPGIGTYFNSAGSAYGSTAAALVCDAATAPTVGWTRANPAAMQALANGQ